MYYTYLLKEPATKRVYIGYTNNLRRRLKEHINKETRSTSFWKSIKLIFYEAFEYRNDATRREQYFKTTKGKRALKLMPRDGLNIAS